MEQERVKDYSKQNKLITKPTVSENCNCCKTPIIIVFVIKIKLDILSVNKKHCGKTGMRETTWKAQEWMSV